MKLRSFLISKLFLSSLLSLSIVGCVSSSKEEITVYYGAMSVSTPIHENGTFEHQETVKNTHFSLSGSVEDLEGKHLTQIDLSIKNNHPPSTKKIKTSLLLTKNEHMFLSGISSTQINTSMINGEKTEKTKEENIYIKIK